MQAMERTSHQFTDGATALSFAMAGRAYLTAVSRKTGTRFTYRVVQADEKSPHFVHVLTGPEMFQFLGTVFPDGSFRHGKKSQIDASAPSAQAWSWLYGFLRERKLPANAELWHDGRCGRCGRPLTVPESITTGIGPVCAEKEAA